ncbi:predicted protein [Arabidopsis lyrata subsp. lyrata]|uniref:Predicted protein n=1 Tax=Arabidopsis lyrata subsp. lyrata TaxID=81972 RepID=D7KZV3_ARALL|nr:predicted protein [Arabidopsis lyrata subsp. lyrata]
MMMSNLPQDLVEEILSRVPLTSTRAVRSTCKKWNALSKDQSFANKHIGNIVATPEERDFLMIMENKAYLIGVNLHGIQNNNVDLSIKRKGKTIDDDVIITLVVLFNPYWGKHKWFKRTNNYGRFDKFAFGYDKSCGSHKILRLFGDYLNNIEIYNLSSDSDSWMVPSVTLEWDIVDMHDDVSLKGNTYWYAKDKESEDYYLLCFDFTRERFGPRLPLPQPFINEGCGSLSVVGEEKLAVLLQHWGASEMEIWVTNKIEPDEVSWSKFLKVYKRPHCFYVANFLIEEEKKVAVVFDDYETKSFKSNIVSNAYIIRENGYFRTVDLSEYPYTTRCGLACSYVPSSVQIM